MGAGTLDELPRWARELLQLERVARLGFLDDEERPRVLPVSYAIHEGAVWSAVDRKPKRVREPARVRYLRSRPQAALTVDRYSDDWSKLAWVQLLGSVALVEAADGAGALAALADRYPQYRDEPPPGPLLRLRPRRLLWWSAAPL